MSEGITRERRQIQEQAASCFISPSPFPSYPFDVPIRIVQNRNLHSGLAYTRTHHDLVVGPVVAAVTVIAAVVVAAVEVVKMVAIVETVARADLATALLKCLRHEIAVDELVTDGNLAKHRAPTHDLDLCVWRHACVRRTYGVRAQETWRPQAAQRIASHRTSASVSPSPNKYSTALHFICER